MSSWRDKPVQVRARYIPRYLWTTASIDVFVGDRCVLRTGGQAKLTGSHSASFSDGGSEHQAELCWGHGRAFRFPYQLRIDGVAVDNSDVQVENRYMIWVPASILAALLLLTFGFLLSQTITMPKLRSEADGKPPLRSETNR